MSPKARRIPGSAAFLAVVHALLLFPGFLAPYDPTAQNRTLPFAPPSRPRLFDGEGRFHARPFVHALRERPGEPGAYEEDRSTRYPIRFLVPGPPYRVAGLWTARLRLFGVDDPARVFLLGSDAYGRDQLSRLLHGGQISLFAGLLAAGLSLGTGLALGTLAGFYRRRADAALMGLAEVFQAVPWLYLLLALRAFLPLHVSPTQAFLLVVGVIGLADWARPARMVRGVVLSARESEYVTAARGFGASDLYLMRRHVVPQALFVARTQAALLVPQYVLAEVVLSFLGLGVGEPVPSWGNMLASLQQYHVLAERWWMWAPAVALVPVFASYYALADALHARSQASRF